MLEIKPSSEKYEDFIRKLISKTFTQEMNIPFKNKEITLSNKIIDSVYIAMKDREPIAFYSIWKNQFHPQSLYFNMVVDQRYRREKIGTRMYKHMEERVNEWHYLQSSFYETSSDGSNFLCSLSFKRYRTTEETSIDVSRIALNLNTMHKFVVENELEAVALSDIRSNNEFWDVVDLVKTCYTRSHLDNPVRDMSLSAWAELIEEDLISEGSFIIKKKEKIIAYALIHENDETSMDLGWRGVVEEQDQIRQLLIELLTNLQIDYAKKSKIKILNLEIDSTDKWSADMLKLLNLERKSKWLSYQKRIKN